MTLFYNGVQYEVETEGDMEPINLLADDGNEVNMQTSDNSKHFQESTWTPKVMHLFLDECIKRKMLIRDPKIKAHKVFLAIHKQMKSKGYTFKVITLERKLRSMKKHLKVVIENKQNPLLKRTYWQYYEKLKTLYPECLMQEPLEGAETEYPPSAESSIAQLIMKDYSSSALSGLTFERKEKETKQDNKKIKNNFVKTADIELLRKEILALEERRTVATEKILIELRQSNKLKEQMLEVNIKLFEETKQMEEY